MPEIRYFFHSSIVFLRGKSYILRSKYVARNQVVFIILIITNELCYKSLLLGKNYISKFAYRRVISPIFVAISRSESEEKGRMKVESEKVYLYRTEINSTEVPTERYRELAYAALSRLDLALPQTGTVVLKPNITITAKPETRIITHPGFIAGMLQALIEKGVATERLVVTEGYGRKAKEKWSEAVGYADVLAEFGLPLTDLNRSEPVAVKVPGGVVYDHYEMAREVTDCAFFFNVPVAKCHNLSCTTLSIKNMQGTVLSPQRHLCRVQEVDEPHAPELARLVDSGLSLQEERFCNKLADLVSARRNLDIPRLAVIDGMVGRDGTAFNEGENHPMGWTLIGENEVHVDTVGTYLFGLDPEMTPYLRVAAARGLGSNRTEEIEVVDLATGEILDSQALAAQRMDPLLMPVSRYDGGYYDRFRADGSVVPWVIDRVNQKRVEDGLELVPIT